MRMSTDALRNRLSLAAIFLAFSASACFGATYRTPNFIVTAPSKEIAVKCGKCAEHYRKVLAEDWLGEEMKRWYKPCRLTVKVGQVGAGGATTFAFDRGEVFGWRMNVQGTLQRILDSVIPHEVSHTVFASHFRRPLPRWADEGAATLIEHESERRRQTMLLKQVWNTSRRIPLRKLLSIKEYPRDMQSVLTLYAEGYSLANFLVQAGGKTRYLEFLETAHRHGWDRAISQHYNLEGVNDLESRWNKWVMAGSPRLDIPKDSQVASQDRKKAAESAGRSSGFERPVIRGQSPEPKSEQKDTPPSSQVASARQAENKPKSRTPSAMPRISEVREESPGWRRMREELKEIPQDFVNPAKDPTRIAASSSRETTEVGGEQNPEPLKFSPPDSRESSSPETPAFRFELDGPSHAPGEQPPGRGRSPDWSAFPRKETARDQTRLGQTSERPFSP